MTDVILTRQRVEPGKEERLREWMAEIRDREDEARATHEDEGMLTESAFLERGDEGEMFLVYYMECEAWEQVVEAFSNSEHDIDEAHERVMEEVLVDGADVGEFELLYHLTNR
jgi:hypothetical protein